MHEAHRLITAHILVSRSRGAYRSNNMFVTTSDGRIEYVAAAPDDVRTETAKLWTDIAVLLKQPMNPEDVFFYASLLHLLFVKIHPYEDGNGRTARLLEKWFLAEKLGTKAWLLESERYYYEHHQLYYSNLRALGLEYPMLDYTKALPFVLMLPQALK